MTAEPAAELRPDLLPAEVVPIDSVTEYPGNPRRGDTEKIRESVRAFGQYRPIVVQKETGHVIGGNHVRKVMREEGYTHINVTWWDCDNAEAARIVAMDNASSDAGEYDTSALLALLTAPELGGDLTGTGYAEDDLARMRAIADLASQPGPGTFPSYGEDLETEYQCPKCKYEWSGKAK